MPEYVPPPTQLSTQALQGNADPREAQFIAAYKEAMIKWAKKTNAEGEGHIGSLQDPRSGLAQAILKESQGGARDGMWGGAFNQLATKAFESYKKDPTTFLNRHAGEDGKEFLQFMSPDGMQAIETAGQPGQAQDTSGEDAMREFAQHMMGPIDMNDPYVKSIVQNVQAAGQRQATNSGLSGGYSVANTERNTAGALAQVGQQRQALGLQALQGAEGIRLADAKMAEDSYMRQYQAQMGQISTGYNQGLDRTQAVGAGIGGALGGVAGAYFGGPGGAQAGFTAGSKFGAGIAGSGYGPMPVPSYVPPSRGGGSRGGY